VNLVQLQQSVIDQPSGKPMSCKADTITPVTQSTNKSIEETKIRIATDEENDKISQE
jgi:hypothetical protein